MQGLLITAGCDTAWNQTRVCSDTFSTVMQCLRPLRHSGDQLSPVLIILLISYISLYSIFIFSKFLDDEDTSTNVIFSKQGGDETKWQVSVGEVETGNRISCVFIHGLCGMLSGITMPFSACITSVYTILEVYVLLIKSCLCSGVWRLLRGEETVCGGC